MSELSPYMLNDEQYAKIDPVLEELIQKNLAGIEKKANAVVDEIYEKIQDAIRYYLEGDTVANFSDLVVARANDIIHALLTGKNPRILEKFVLGWEGDVFRNKVYLEHKDAIQNQLIEDLRKEVENLKERLEWARDRF